MKYRIVYLINIYSCFFSFKRDFPEIFLILQFAKIYPRITWVFWPRKRFCNEPFFGYRGWNQNKNGSVYEMMTYLSCCHWPWCCFVCELHRKFLKFSIIRCDRQDVAAAQSSIPISCPSSNFLILHGLAFWKGLFHALFYFSFLQNFLSFK